MTILGSTATVCSECGSAFATNKKEQRLLHPEFDIFCGGVCLVMRIKKEKRPAVMLSPVPSKMRYVPGEFRSQMEKEVYYFLTYQGLSLVHEPGSLRLFGEDRYVPDFLVKEWNCLLEVKGLWYQGARQKLSDTRQSYPDLELILIPSYLPRRFSNASEWRRKAALHHVR